jgi:hypothetical protein
MNGAIVIAPDERIGPSPEVSLGSEMVCGPGLRSVFSDDTVVRCATGLLIPPSISNPVTGNGAPSALTCSLTAFPEVTLKNWLETSTLTVQLCFPH